MPRRQTTRPTRFTRDRSWDWYTTARLRLIT
jgi:hypothetical protein